MPDTLRERIAPVLQQHYGLNDNVSVRNRGVVMSVGNFAEWVLDAILPLVEQEREKWERATDAVVEKMAEKDAAIAAIEAGLRAEFANGGTYEGHDIISAFGEFIEHHAKLESALAVRDAQIAALRDERDELLREGVKWISDRAEQDAQIATLRKSIADIQFVAAKARDTMPMGVYPRNQFKHVSDLATMAADTLSLRERIAQVIRDNRDAGSLTDAILPVVEQAIREEREKALREAAEFARHTSEQDEKITKLEGYEQTHLGNLDDLRAALAEKDAQIREWETGALAASTEIVKLRQQLRETRESFDAVVRAAGPFMPPVPEKTDA